MISSIEVTFFHGIGAVCVTHHPGLSVTYPAGSYHIASNNPLGGVQLDAVNLVQTPERATADQLTVQVSTPLDRHDHRLDQGLRARQAPRGRPLAVSSDSDLTLQQKIIIAVLAGAAIGAVSAIVQHHATRFVRSRSIRRLPAKQS
ncbi:MAG: hypothetical protein ACREIA_26925 [Opitutaceae bacterium]